MRGNYPPIWVPNQAPAVKITTVPPGAKLHATVVSAGCTVYLSSSRTILEICGGGDILTAGEGPIEVNWTGDVWALGLPANPVSPVQVNISIQ